jgi:hypothetical protein
MGLVIGVALCVVAFTALTAIAIYVTDQCADRHEK